MSTMPLLNITKQDISECLEYMRLQGFPDSSIQHIKAGLEGTDRYGIEYASLYYMNFRSQEKISALRRELEQTRRVKISTAYIKTHTYYATA